MEHHRKVDDGVMLRGTLGGVQAAREASRFQLAMFVKVQLNFAIDRREI